MGKRIWLDDERPTPVGYTHTAKNYDEAIKLLESGDVEFFSFDHDLSPEHYAGDFTQGNKTGHDVAKWIEEQAYNGEIPKMGWKVHSMNPSGGANIRRAMAKADEYWSR